MSRKRSLRQLAWEKSRGDCCLCGLPMQLSVDNADPLGYTIEHMVPKGKGGTNDLENLDGSHRWCNQYKGDARMDELPKGVRQFLRWKIKHLILHRKV